MGVVPLALVPIGPVAARGRRARVASDPAKLYSRFPPLPRPSTNPCPIPPTPIPPIPTLSRTRPVRTCCSTRAISSIGSRGGPEALDRARREDKPILLSIGYSACHWCHVMAHESFEDEGDRAADERALRQRQGGPARSAPDIDKIYQTAHQLLARRAGGWPLTVVMTPDDHVPFFAGTYFPDSPRHGMPSFRQVLTGVGPALPRAARRHPPPERLARRGAGGFGVHRRRGRRGRRGRSGPDRSAARRGARIADAIVRSAPRRFRRRAEVPPPDQPRTADARPRGARRGRRRTGRRDVHVPQDVRRRPV